MSWRKGKGKMVKVADLNPKRDSLKALLRSSLDHYEWLSVYKYITNMLKMNKLFRVLFVGAYIPYAVLLSYYFTRIYIAYFFILSVYLASCFSVLTHKPYLEKGILAWVRAKRVCELLLVGSFSVRAYYKSTTTKHCRYYCWYNSGV